MSVDGAPAEGTTPQWFESIPADMKVQTKADDGTVAEIALRDHPKVKEFKDVGSLARSYVEAQKLIGKKQVQQGLVAPGDDATDEQRQAFQAELRKMNGVPDTHEGYSIKMPELPDGYDPQKGMLPEFIQKAHGQGLNNSQVQWFVDMFAGIDKQARDKAASDLKAQQEAMQKEWGDKYEENLHLGEKVLSKFGDEAFVNAVKGNLGNDPGFLRLLVNIGKGVSEDTLKGTGASVPATGKTQEEISALMRSEAYTNSSHQDHLKTHKEVEAWFKAKHPGSRRGATLNPGEHVGRALA